MVSWKYVAAPLCLLAASLATAERGRPFMITLPEGPERAAFIETWNAELARDFDLVFNAAGASDPFADLAAITTGETGWLMTSTSGAAEQAQNAPGNVAWIFLDLFGAPGDLDALKEVQEAVSIARPRKWKVAVLPPLEKAASWGPLLANQIDAYIIPLAGEPYELLEVFRPIADATTKTNGRCRIGVYLTDSDLSTPEALQHWLPFYNDSDEVVLFYGGPWPAEAPALTEAMTVLNQHVEGPRPSEGMHQDRFRPPDVPMEAATEKQMRLVLSVASLALLIAAPLFIYLVRPNKPRA